MVKTPLPARVDALRTAVDHARGRLDDEQVDRAARVVAQADQRLAISGDATVVALAGATGSGKSSLFNALADSTLATAGMRRPTTASPMAVTFGAESTGGLLDWLDVRNRHVVDARGLDAMVLLDLPDHDSTATAHRAEVDRLVQLVDVMVWVVDPQKYADAALHENYLRPLAHHAPNMIVALNQADRLDPQQTKQIIADLHGLLADDGLTSVDIVAVSAHTGQGIGDLRKLLARQVSDKRAAAQRLTTEVQSVAAALLDACGTASASGTSKSAIDRLVNSLATAAGVPIVADATQLAWKLRGTRATGWPVTAWLTRFKPDPLRRLHLDRVTKAIRGRHEAAVDYPRTGRTNLPTSTGVQQARVDSAIRELADDVSRGLPRPWQLAVRDAARQHQQHLADDLDHAIASTDLRMDRGHAWWRVVTVVQWLLIVTVVAGLVWLGIDVILAYFQLPPLPRYDVRALPLPTVLVLGGVMAGLVVAGLSRLGVHVGAKRARGRTVRRLSQAVFDVARERVIEPVDTELAQHDHLCAALELAKK